MKKISLLFMAIFLIYSCALYSQDKKVLFEEFTNASCGPCAANNPLLKTYLDSKGDSIVAIMYHTEFPGFDPMHNLNPSQVMERRQGYYSDVNAVPWLKGDGDLFPDIWPFSLANFDAAFNTRKVIVPGVHINVSDSRITGDSVKSVVTLNVVQNMPVGNYKLRVMATEKIIVYASPPGSNGERIFEHVFRLGIPDMNGVSFPLSIGTYQFTFKYKLNPEWIDSNIVTVAFIQNDVSNKEVINAAVSENVTTSLNNLSGSVPEKYKLHQNYPNPFNPSTEFKVDVPVKDFVRIELYNNLGQSVKTIVNNILNPGSYKYFIDGSNLNSGIYFLKLNAGNFFDAKKIVLTK